MGSESDWEFVACDLCGGAESRCLHTIPFEDAPNGVSRIVECDICRLRYLSPRPTASAISKYYPNDYGAYVGRRRGRLKQRVWDLCRDCCSRTPIGLPRPVEEGIARLVVGRFDINVRLDGPTRPRVLDVGCGFGDLLLYLASRGAEVVGIDSDERACRRAREYGLDVRHGSLLEQCFESGRFDVVVMSHSLEHMHCPRAIPKEVRRLLGNGGLLHVAVPNGRSEGFQEEGVFWGSLFFPLHLYYFDEFLLSSYLEGAGFRVISQSFKTIWLNHRSSWLAAAMNHGVVAALRMAVHVTDGTLRSRAAGDTLRMVALAA